MARLTHSDLFADSIQLSHDSRTGSIMNCTVDTPTPGEVRVCRIDNGIRFDARDVALFET